MISMHRQHTARLLAAIATAMTLAAGSAFAHEKGGADVVPGPSAAIQATTCASGGAAGFPCSNIDLLAYLPGSSIGGGNGNDIWGWTDPVTGREYALVGRSTGTAFVDITTPSQPVYVGKLPTRTVESSWRDIETYGDYAIIASEAFGHGVQIFDLRSLRSVVSPPQTFSPTQLYGGFTTHTIAVNPASGFAYAAGTNTCNGGLHMIDIRNPLTPVFAGCYPDDGYTHDTQCVNYAGPDAAYVGREICFNSNEDTLTIVDVTTKSTPRLVSRTGYAGYGYTHQGWLTEDHAYFFVDDELDEINSHHNTRTYVWDVADLDAPRLVGFHTGTTAAIDHNQYVRGNYIFQANYRAGLRILRIDNAATATLTEVGYFDVYPPDNNPSFNGAWSAYPFFDSGTVVVNGIEQGLFVVRPHLATSVPTPTATPTSAPPSPTVAAAPVISGRITYYSTGAPVEDVTVMFQGPSAAGATSDANGVYVSPVLSNATWNVTPFKAGAILGAISALDAVYALQSAVGLRQLDAAQQLACDVSGQAGVTAFDATLILRHRVGLINSFPVGNACGGDWLFAPNAATVANQQVQPPVPGDARCTTGALSFDPLGAAAPGQDFSALLIGDCTGNWHATPAGAGATLSAHLAPASSVRVGRARRDGRGHTLVPISLPEQGTFHAIELQLRHDPKLRAGRVLQARVLADTAIATNTTEPGLLRIAVASARPLPTDGRPLLWVRFSGRGRILPRAGSSF
jgi:choice-of-anchor B domain-containing protein